MALVPDQNKVAVAMAGIIGMLLAMAKVMKAMSNMNTLKTGDFFKIGLIMIGITAALAILLKAVVEIVNATKDITEDKILVSAMIIAGMIIVLGSMVKLMTESSMITGGSKFDAKAISLIGFAVAIYIMAKAMTKLSELEVSQIVAAGAIIIGVIALLALFELAFAKANKISDGRTFNVFDSLAILTLITGIGLIIAEMFIMGKLLQDDKLLKTFVIGMAGVALALLTVVGIGAMLKGADLLKAAGSIAIVVVALAAITLVMTYLVNCVKEWNKSADDSVGMAIGMIVVELAMLLGALFALKKLGNTEGAKDPAALLIKLAAALIVLAASIKIMASIPSDKAWGALLRLAVALGVLVAFGALVNKFCQGFDKFTSSLFKFAGAIALVGAGLLAFSVGLAIIGVAGTAAAAAIPPILANLALGLISFCQVLAAGAEDIGQCVTALLIAFLNSISAIAAPLVDALFNLLVAVINGLAKNLTLNGGGLIDALANLAYSLWALIVELFKEIIGAFGGLFGGGVVADKINNWIDREMEAIKPASFDSQVFGKGVKESVKAAKPEVEGAAKELSDTANQTLADNPLDVTKLFDTDTLNLSTMAIGKDGASSLLTSFESSLLSGDAGSTTVNSIMSDLASSITDNSGVVTDAGTGIMENLSDSVIGGLSNGRDLLIGENGAVTDLFGDNGMIGEIKNIFQSESGVSRTGEELITEFTGSMANAMETKGKEDVLNASKTVAKVPASEMSKSEYLERIKENGSNLTYGYGDGITDPKAVNYVRRAIDYVVDEAIAESQRRADEHSPSKVFMKIGAYMTLGMAIGIGSESDSIKESSEQLVNNALFTVEETLARAQSILENEDCLTITPVLDMTNIEEGVSEIGSMFGKSAVKIASNVSGSQNVQNGGTISPDVESNAQPSVVNNFTQNNYSPKALSRIDIYRQTKNIFRAEKGVYG